LANANLSNAQLAGAVATYTDFRDAVMRGCKLVRADLRHADLSGANLQDADLSGADLRGADLRGAVLVHTVMAEIEDEGADFSRPLTDKPAGRPLSELPAPLSALIAEHKLWVESFGAAGRKLDLSGFDLRGAGGLAGAALAMMKANGAVLFGLDLDGAA